jgi:hypothetical protein
VWIGKVRNFQQTFVEAKQTIKDLSSLEETKQSRWRWFKRRRESNRHDLPSSEPSKQIKLNEDAEVDASQSIPVPLRFQAQFTNVPCLQQLTTPRSGMMTMSGRGIRDFKVPVPSPFLQEMAHLVSLLTAVSMATLRVDHPRAEVPITEYVSGQAFPPVDPDDLDEEIKKEYGEDFFFQRWIVFCLGLSRNEKYRTLYNKARPFPVLGGVSDHEVHGIASCNGDLAKVGLCTLWLQEFLTREILNGSTGEIRPPILSRLYQYISDGTKFRYLYRSHSQRSRRPVWDLDDGDEAWAT